jgi:hypothetical protein
MKRKKPTLVKATSIALILFSTTICFSQNSTTPVTNVTSTASSKIGPGQDVKAPLHEESIGTTPKSPSSDPLQNMPYSLSPSNKNQDKKTSSADKNTSKPH